MAGPAVLTVADTIAKSFLLAAETRGNRPAIREKKFGIWQPTSWRQWLQISKEIAYGLHAVGFAPGDVASIVANAVPAFRPASIRPIRRPSWNISSTTPGPG
jgi:long-chain acyl-CoA synthetase